MADSTPTARALPLGCRRIFFFSSRRRHTRSDRDWSSDVCFFRSCRARHARHGGLHAAPGNPFQGVRRDLVGARVIIRELGGTEEGGFCAESARDGGYFLVIGCRSEERRVG